MYFNTHHFFIGPDGGEAPYLMNQPIKCPGDTYMKEWYLTFTEDKRGAAYNFDCCPLPTGATCSSETTRHYTEGTRQKKGINSLAKQKVDCGPGAFLKSFELKESVDLSW